MKTLPLLLLLAVPVLAADPCPPAASTGKSASNSPTTRTAPAATPTADATPPPAAPKSRDHAPARPAHLFM